VRAMNRLPAAPGCHWKAHAGSGEGRSQGRKKRIRNIGRLAARVGDDQEAAQAAIMCAPATRCCTKTAIRIAPDMTRYATRPETLPPGTDHKRR